MMETTSTQISDSIPGTHGLYYFAWKTLKFWIKDWVKLLKYQVYSSAESEPKMKDKRHPELFQKTSN